MSDRLSEHALGGVEHALLFGNPVSSSSTRALLAEVRDRRAAEGRVRALHRRAGVGASEDAYCLVCPDGQDDWPCATIRALDGDQ